MAFVTPVTVIGGSSGGQNFSCYGGTNGKVLSKIGVWAAESRIKAIKVWLTDDDPQTFGDPTQPSGEGPLHYQEFTLDSTELITKLSLWGNGTGTRTGWIQFHTNRGRSFDFGMYSWDKKTEYPVDVGSGICAGVMGGAGSDIDSLGFLFLQTIQSSKLLNVQYPTLSFDTGGIAPQALEKFQYVNNNSTPTQWEFKGDTTVSVSSSWSVTAGLALHATVSVEAGIPEVAKVKEEFGWQLSASTTHQTSNTITHTLSWRVSGTAAVGETINLTAVSGRGEISVPYTGSMEVTVGSGAGVTFQYPLRGQYSGVSYSGVTVS